MKSINLEMGQDDEEFFGNSLDEGEVVGIWEIEEPCLKKRFKHRITIDAMSKATGISKSAIKYWHRQGIVSARKNKQNGYLEFETSASFYEICDMYFCRQIGLSIDDIKKLYYKCSEHTAKKFFAGEIKRINDRIAQLNDSLKILQANIDILDLIINNRYAPVKLNAPDFDVIVEFDIYNVELTRARVKYNFDDITFSGSKFHQGIACFAPRGGLYGGKVVWRKDDGIYFEFIGYNKCTFDGQDYIYQSLWRSDNSLGKIKQGSQATIHEYIKEFNDMGYVIRNVMAKYLTVFTFEGESNEHIYFKTWICVRPMTAEELVKYGIARVVPLDEIS